MWGLKYNKHIFKIFVAPPANFGILLLLEHFYTIPT